MVQKVPMCLRITLIHREGTDESTHPNVRAHIDMHSLDYR